MTRPEGIYEIVETNTARSAKRVGRWVVFPFDIVIGNVVDMLYPMQHNPSEVGGKWLSTSAVQDIIDEKEQFTIVTNNTRYTFERVL